MSIVEGNANNDIKVLSKDDDSVTVSSNPLALQLKPDEGGINDDVDRTRECDKSGDTSLDDLNLPLKHVDIAENWQLKSNDDDNENDNTEPGDVSEDNFTPPLKPNKNGIDDCVKTTTDARPSDNILSSNVCDLQLKPIENSRSEFDKDIYREKSNSITNIDQQRIIKRKILLILVTVNILAFMSSFAFWIQAGVLPYLTRKLGVTPVTFGYMESSFAFYQMITSPLFGRLGDIIGVRFIYILSEIGCIMAYGSLAFANSIPALFLTRIPALLMHGLQCAYMVITDVTTPEKRADMLGKLGVSHGLGMIMGAFTGGVVTEILGEKSAALLASIGSIVSLCVVCMFIPARTKQIRRELDDVLAHTSNTADDKITLGLTEIVNVLKYANLKFMLLIKMVIALPYSLLYSMFSMAVMDYYHLGPKMNGILLAYVGVLSIFVQGCFIGLITKRFSDYFNIQLAIFLSMIGFMFLIISNSVILLVVVISPLATGGSVSHILLMAIITKVVPNKDTGSALGLVFALHAIVRSFAPTMGGQIFTHIGWPFFGAIGYVVHFLLMAYIWLFSKEEYFS